MTEQFSPIDETTWIAYCKTCGKRFTRKPTERIFAEIDAEGHKTDNPNHDIVVRTLGSIKMLELQIKPKNF